MTEYYTSLIAIKKFELSIFRAFGKDNPIERLQELISLLNGNLISEDIPMASKRLLGQHMQELWKEIPEEFCLEKVNLARAIAFLDEKWQEIVYNIGIGDHTACFFLEKSILHELKKESVSEQEEKFQQMGKNANRIILVHSSDIGGKANREVMASAKLVVQKHGIDQCIILSLEETAKAVCAVNPDIHTIQVIGHGNVYIEGASDPRDPSKTLTEQYAAKQRKEAMVFLGPFKGNAQRVAEDISIFMMHVENITHLRLTACMHGFPKENALQEMETRGIKFKQDAKHTRENGRLSASVESDPEDPETSVFHSHSVAGMVWGNMADKGMTKHKDFCLTASAAILNPQPYDRPVYFAGSSRERFKPDTAKAPRWETTDGEMLLKETKAISQGTANSSKLQRQSESRLCSPPKYRTLIPRSPI
jgi:hypothetical protein